ncbi:MAG: ABC transporter substrate-binding protein [Phycisphaerales bacterium]
MPNRFGIRHAVLSLLLLALTVSVWLNMLQLDRVWEKLGEVRAAQGRLEEAVVRLERRGVAVPAVATPVPSDSGAATAPAPSPTAATARDDSWAKPGVPIKRVQRPAWINDPTKEPDYQVGGIITEAFEQDLPRLMPYGGGPSNATVTRVLTLVQERLADINPKTLAFEGVLAEAWQMDPMGLWLRVRIDDEAVWSDGEPITADDVKFTLDLIKNPDYGVTAFKSQFEGVAQSTVLSDRVIEVTFSEALAQNEDATLRVVPLPRHIYGKLSSDEHRAATGVLVGSGPYMLANGGTTLADQWKKGDPVELKRNPRWRGPKRPADGFRFVARKDGKTQLAAVTNLEADLARGVPEHLKQLADAPVPGVRVVSWLPVNTGPVSIAWNTANRGDGLSPCAGVLVRQALTHALDRERMNRELFGGAGVVVSGPFPIERPGYDREVPPLPFSMDRANTLLDQAGWPKGPNDKRADSAGKPLSFRIIAPSSLANGPVWSAYLRDQFTKGLGAECAVELLDQTAYDQARTSRDYDGIISAFAPDSPEPNLKQHYHSSSIGDGGNNNAQWSSQEADAIIDAARKTLDRDARNALWRELHRLIHREQPVTFIASRPMVMLVSDRIGNFPTNKMVFGADRAEMYIRKARP